MKIRLLPLLLITGATLFFATHLTQAQTVAKKKRVHAPATVKGFIGGEAQHQYILRARKGQTMTGQISWRKEDDNTASFSVYPVKGSSEPFGTESDGGKSWTGKMPKSGDYVIAVVAHPSAHYTLKVRLK